MCGEPAPQVFCVRPVLSGASPWVVPTGDPLIVVFVFPLEALAVLP